MMLVDTLAFNLLKETKFRKMISGKERDESWTLST